MAARVSIGNMADAIMKELNAYADTTADGVKTAVQRAAKTVKSEIADENGCIQEKLGCEEYGGVRQ